MIRRWAPDLRPVPVAQKDFIVRLKNRQQRLQGFPGKLKLPGHCGTRMTTRERVATHTYVYTSGLSIPSVTQIRHA